MRIISPEAARTIVFVAPEDIRPLSGNIFLPRFIKAVKDRYLFQRAPSAADEDTSVLTFKTGLCSADGRVFPVQELAILQSAAIVDALRSDECETFLRDILNWAGEAFGWREPESFTVRTFSSVVVEFEHDAEQLIGSFNSVFRLLSGAIESRYGITIPYDLRSILFSCDPNMVPSSAVNTEFTIQRRAEAPFSRNRYFCTGPFPTDEMFDLLAKIEQALLESFPHR